MRYTLNDTTAYGIYNGLSSVDLKNAIHAEAEKTGLTVVDYSFDEIVRQLNRDPQLKETALSSYKPYPAQAGWSDEYKEQWVELVEHKEAPGYGEVPDDLILQKLQAILLNIYDTVVVQREKKETDKQTRTAEILSHVVRVTSEVKSIYDEGGKTEEYIHRVFMPSGKCYVFHDRNVFDIGRVINYNGAIITRRGNRVGLNRWADDSGWNFEPLALTSEIVLAYNAAALYGFAGCSIRM